MSPEKTNLDFVSPPAGGETLPRAFLLAGVSFFPAPVLMFERLIPPVVSTAGGIVSAWGTGVVKNVLLFAVGGGSF